MADDKSMKETIKITCNDIWKVYGANPGQFFPNSDTEQTKTALADHIRAQGHIVAAGNVSFDIHEGEIFVIMGLSGSGKSTVLRCLSLLVEPTCGHVMLDGIDLLAASAKEMIEIRRHKMGMVFQNFGLLPHLNVLDNVAFPLKNQGIPRDERQKLALGVIELVGLDGRENAYPHELSGGQQQRVGIARSLAVEPEVWFLDEPFSALDPLIRNQMQDEFLRLQKQLNKTIVFVTHDFHEALKLADRICIMKDGFIVQTGAPEDIVLRPANEYVYKFTGDVPFAKVLSVGAVMGPPNGQGGKCAAIRSDALLEEAIKLFDGEADEIDVTGTDGEIVGSLTTLQVMRGISQNVDPPAEE